MPPRSRRSFSSSHRGPARRRVIWAQYNATFTFTANSQWFSVDLLQTYKAAVGNSMAKATVMRTHASLVEVTGMTVADRIWTGFRVADVSDTSGSVTTLPTISNPRDDPYVDWAFMSRHSLDNLGDLHPSYIGGTAGESGQCVTYDLKSKRKLENLTDTWSFVLMQDTVTTVASTYHFFARTLLALP
jgi:hypothetical protein